MSRWLASIFLFLELCATIHAAAVATQDFKIMCYYDEKAAFDRGVDKGKVLPKDLLSGTTAEYCTHVIYAFAIVGNDSKSIQPRNAKSEELYKDIPTLKGKGIKVIVAIGGADDSKLTEKYIKLVTNLENRNKFVESVVAFLTKHKFDGVQLQWEYPVCRDGDCTKGSVEERTGYGELMKQLSEALKPKNLNLSAAISPKPDVIDKAYNIQVLAKYLDWVLIEGYKYNLGWSKIIETSPFYNVNTTSEPSVVTTVMQMHTKGVPTNKLILGASLAGTSFVLSSPDKHQYGAPATGPGAAAEFTKTTGMMGYFEICDNVVNKGWKVVQERKNQLKMNPIAFKDNQLVTYEDTSDFIRKSKFIKEHKMMGAGVWSADLDDVRNVCKCGNFPMLRALNQELREATFTGKKTFENCA